MAVSDARVESDGQAVDVAINHTINKGQLIVAEGWLGITTNGGVSGGVVAIAMDQREYEIEVPTGFAVAKGDLIYVDTTQVTNGVVNSSAWFTASGSNRRLLGRATRAHWTFDSKRFIRVRLVSPGI